ncbi:MAG TPA: FmdE family protein [Polyangiales bacterium]|nr:FmdE family protein [Polyangiales bacterium]
MFALRSFALSCLLAACASTSAPAASATPTQHGLDAVAAVHGGAGPWAVAGYRMGEFALQKLGLERGSFDLDVTHASPPEVQYSCIADGAAAATGASLGKLNLHWQEVALPDTRTTYLRKSTGQTVELEVTTAFAKRYADVPRPLLKSAGEEVMRLADNEIFEVTPAAAQ